MNINYFLIIFGLLLMFGPVIIQALFPASMYGFLLMISGLPGLTILAIGLMRKHKDENSKEYLKQKNSIFRTSINNGVFIITMIGLLVVIPALIRWCNDYFSLNLF